MQRLTDTWSTLSSLFKKKDLSARFYTERWRSHRNYFKSETEPSSQVLGTGYEDCPWRSGGKPTFCWRTSWFHRKISVGYGKKINRKFQRFYSWCPLKEQGRCRYTSSHETPHTGTVGGVSVSTNWRRVWIYTPTPSIETQVRVYFRPFLSVYPRGVYDPLGLLTYCLLVRNRYEECRCRPGVKLWTFQQVEILCNSIFTWSHSDKRERMEPSNDGLQSQRSTYFNRIIILDRVSRPHS